VIGVLLFVDDAQPQGAFAQPAGVFGSTADGARSTRGANGLGGPMANGPSLGGPLIALTTLSPEGQQAVVLVDTQTRRLGSYHIDTKSGQVSLRCVRDIRWDLQMDEFNGTEPSPEQNKALLRSR
jgi:hypothetical protein